MAAKGMQERGFIIGRSWHMHEDFRTIIGRGFNSWTRNLNICIPFVLSYFASMILFSFLFVLLGVLLFSSNAGITTDPTALSNEEIVSIVIKGFTENLGTSILLLIVFSLLNMYVSSFFSAGAVGMAKKAVETGDTVFADMLVSGSKNTYRFFLINLLMSLLLLSGIVFIVPGALNIGDFSELLVNPEAQLPGMGLLILGIFLWSLYMFVITLIFSLAPYALVIDELDPLEALKTSLGFFKENKLDIFFIWIIYIGLSLINTYIGELLGSGIPLAAGLRFLVPLVILQPLLAVFLTRLYMSRKGKKIYNPSDLLSIPESF